MKIQFVVTLSDRTAAAFAEVHGAVDAAAVKTLLTDCLKEEIEDTRALFDDAQADETKDVPPMTDLPSAEDADGEQS